MKRRNDLYNLGNDYNQEVSAYFLEKDNDVKTSGFYGKAYSDGLYHYTIKPAYELSGGASALNKRILNVPQSAWTPNEALEASAFSAAPDASAVFSPDYATAIADDTVDGPFKK